MELYYAVEEVAGVGEREALEKSRPSFAWMHKAEPSSKIDAAAEGRSLTVAALLGGENGSIGAATVRERFPDRLRHFRHSLETPLAS